MLPTITGFRNQLKNDFEGESSISLQFQIDNKKIETEKVINREKDYSFESPRGYSDAEKKAQEFNLEFNNQTLTPLYSPNIDNSKPIYLNIKAHQNQK